MTATTDRRRETAAEWIVRLDEAGNDEAGEQLRAECLRWRAQDPQHERLFSEQLRLWQALQPAAKHREGARAASLMLAAGVAILVAAQLPWATWTADERVAVGERKTIALSDGSRITLDSGSVANIVFDEGVRDVHLLRGQLLADVVADAAGRPFRVTVPDGIAQARGTRYTVRIDPESTAVTVIESRVVVIPQDQPAAGQEIGAGGRLRFDRSGILESGNARNGAASWANGQLLFNDAPLQSVIDELSRYHRGYIHLSKDAQQLHFTGSLPTDTAQALAMLEQALPVRTSGLGTFYRTLSVVR